MEACDLATALVACRLAGLSALETQYAGLVAPAQMERAAMIRILSLASGFAAVSATAGTLTCETHGAHQALQNYFASVPSGPKTIAAWKEAAAPVARVDSLLEVLDRAYDGLRKAGLPEE
jgi:hypothetical protein